MIMTVLLMVSIFYMDGAAVQAKSKFVKVGNGKYTITSKKMKIVRYDGVSKKSVTTVSIPNTVKIKKKTYKVVSVKANALKGNKKIKTLTIGKNVKTIGKKTFYGCKNLEKITIKSTKLTKKSVGSKAFGKLNSKLVVKVPESKLAAYQKLLKSRGVTGKNQKIVSSQDKKKDSNKINTKPTVNFKLNDGTDYTKYGAGDVIPLVIRVDIPLDFYGYWEEVKNVKSDYKSVCGCGLIAKSKEDRIIHGLQSGHTDYVIRTKGNSAFDASVWHPDSTPCGIVSYANLPEGIEIIEDSISVAQLSERGTLIENVTTDDYSVSIEDKNLTINISNIKAGGFCYSNGDIRYRPIVASFSAKITDTASTVNPISASVSYSQGQNSGNVSGGSIPIFTSELYFESQSQNNTPLAGGYTLYKLKQYKLGTGYEPIYEEKNGTSFTLPALGTGQYKLVQTTTPAGYKRMGDYEFCISGDASSSGFTSLKITDLAGNTINAPGGTAWTANLTTATLSSKIINEIDETQTKEITATIKYDLNGEIQTDATETLKDTAQILETDKLISTAKVQEKTFIGYKVGSITVNGDAVSSLPETVNDGDTIIYHYVIDENQKHTISARVRYVLGNDEQYSDEWSAVQEVQVLSNEIDTSADFGGKQFEKSYDGCKLSKIVIANADGTRKEITLLPKTLQAGSSVIYYYVVDDGLMETLSMTVKYSLEDLNGQIHIQDDDTFVYRQEVKVTESDGYLKNVILPEKTYPGYKFYQYTYENGSPIGQSLTRVQNGATVLVYYEIDTEAQGTWTATVQHKCGEEIKKEIPLTVTGLYWDYGYEFGLYTDGITAEEYPGYRFDRITINDKEVVSLPEMLQDGDVVVFHYVP